MSIKLNKNCWRLVLAAQVAFCSGCLSTGSKVAETRDPFVEATRIATKSQAQPVAQSGPAAIPTPRPLPSVVIPVEATESLGHSVELMAFEQGDSGTNIAEIVNPEPTSVEPPTNQEQFIPIQPMAQTPIEAGVYPIDLANALGLGGADNLQVRQARTRLYQAQANHLQAKTLWLPSIRLGLGYNKLDGRLQETQGNVIEVERNSLFFGGGLGLGNSPLPGGAGGPPRMFVNLSLADAYFKPLAACQVVAAHGAAERVASNDSLAEIAIGYHSLLEAHGRLANAHAATEMASRMVDLVEDFERAGFSSQTEVSRARTARARWQREVSDAQRQAMTTSARLARVLRLPPQVQLAPVEEYLMPIDFVDMNSDLDAMIGQAWRSRPEIWQEVAEREAACFRVQEEKWRPWIPNVYAGTTYGGFGGGTSNDFASASDRSDVDLVAVWELENLGAGNVAKQRLRRGELHEQVLQYEALRDRIAAEVVAASADVACFRQQMEIAQEAISTAEESYRLNEQRIRGNEGLPIELLQSITALAEARNAYNEAVANYNRSQYRLLRALGTPAGVPAEVVDAS